MRKLVVITVLTIAKFATVGAAAQTITEKQTYTIERQITVPQTVAPQPQAPQIADLEIECPRADDTVHTQIKIDTNNLTEQFWSISHRLAGGQVYDRSNQYTSTRVWQKVAGTAEWFWGGIQIADMTHTIVGSLRWDQTSGWWYGEAHFRNGKMVANDLFHCTVLQHGD